MTWGGVPRAVAATRRWLLPIVRSLPPLQERYEALHGRSVEAATADAPLGATEYFHGSRRRTGSHEAPQVRPEDPEIEVRTAWAPLLDREAPKTRVRPEKAGDAAKYAADGRLLLQSTGFAAPKDAGQAIARLQQQGESALAALAGRAAAGSSGSSSFTSAAFTAVSATNIAVISCRIAKYNIANL